MLRIERILAKATQDGTITVREATAIAIAVKYTNGRKSDVFFTREYETSAEYTLASLIEEEK